MQIDAYSNRDYEGAYSDVREAYAHMCHHGRHTRGRDRRADHGRLPRLVNRGESGHWPGLSS